MYPNPLSINTELLASVFHSINVRFVFKLVNLSKLILVESPPVLLVPITKPSKEIL